jgi:Methyltransferase domain
MCWVRHSRLDAMNLHVNTNLTLEFPPDIATRSSPKKKADTRAALAAQFIPSGARVLDLGGGTALRSQLPNGCHYRAIDRRAHENDSLVTDLNAGDFPTGAASQCDVIVMLGVLEHIVDLESLFTHLRFCKHDIILSYPATDLTKDLDRTSLGYVNHLSFFDLALLFDRYGFRIECTTPIDGSQVLMRLTPTEWLAPVGSCNVAVISDETGSFSARLGCQIINALLPGETEVHHLTTRTLNEARSNYDLVVLGIGNGLFPMLLGEDLLDVISRGNAAIGIFGTQGRELISRPAMDRLIERLDTWFARYEDDVLLYGRGRNNVVHVGDWLIDQFPLTRPINNEPLVVGGEPGQELALDRAIRTIQDHKQVYSTVPAALLCALTSAELAAYAEAPAQQPGLASGQFRSMLIDVFGRAFPEQKFFLVDRDAVARYKGRVHRAVAKVGARIGSILRNVAVAA